MKLNTFTLIIVFLVFSVTSVYAQVFVIANKNVSANSIDKSTLKNLFELNSSSLDGTKVKLFDKSSDDDAKLKFYSCLGTSSA